MNKSRPRRIPACIAVFPIVLLTIHSKAGEIRLIRTISSGSEDVQTHAAFYTPEISADGSMMVSSSGHGENRRKVHVWDLKTGKLRSQLDRTKGDRFSATFSRDGTALVTIDTNMSGGQVSVNTPPVPPHPPLTLSRTRTTYACPGHAHLIVRDARTLRVEKVLMVPPVRGNTVFSTENKAFIFQTGEIRNGGGFGGTSRMDFRGPSQIEMWHVGTGQRLASLDFPEGQLAVSRVGGLRLSPDQKILAVTSVEGIQAYLIGEKELIPYQKLPDTENALLDFAQDGVLATAQPKYPVKLWKLRDSKFVVDRLIGEPEDGKSATIYAIAFGSIGSQTEIAEKEVDSIGLPCLAVVCHGGVTEEVVERSSVVVTKVSTKKDRVELWNYKTGAFVGTVEHEQVFHAALSTTKTLITLAPYEAKIWDISTVGTREDEAEE